MAGSEFPETRWTLIQRTREDDGGSLEEWCRGYWRPVRDYICAQGKSTEEASELAQAFFEALLSREREKILPEKLAGSFRAYLKRSVKNFVTDRWRAEQSQKRGGGVVDLEFEDDQISSGEVSPDRAFEQAWVLTVLQRAMDRLEKEMEEAGKGEFFKAIAGLLDGRSVKEDRTALAARFGMKDGAFRVTLHRLRGRFRELMEDELRETVSSRSELEEEIRYLLAVWS